MFCKRHEDLNINLRFLLRSGSVATVDRRGEGNLCNCLPPHLNDATRTTAIITNNRHLNQSDCLSSKRRRLQQAVEYVKQNMTVISKEWLRTAQPYQPVQLKHSTRAKIMQAPSYTQITMITKDESNEVNCKEIIREKEAIATNENEPCEQGSRWTKYAMVDGWNDSRQLIKTERICTPAISRGRSLQIRITLNRKL